MEKCGKRGGGGASAFVERMKNSAHERSEPTGTAAEGLLGAKDEVVREPGAGEKGLGEVSGQSAVMRMGRQRRALQPVSSGVCGRTRIVLRHTR